MNKEAQANAEVLIEDVMRSVKDYLQNGRPISYQYFIGELMYRMCETAAINKHENLSQASQMLNMRRTTMHEYLKARGWKRSMPAKKGPH